MPSGRRGGRTSRLVAQKNSASKISQIPTRQAAAIKAHKSSSPEHGLKIIACGMIAREILALKQQFGLVHIDLTCLRADYHHHPEKIAPALDLEIERAREQGWNQIFVGYADCGSGGDIDKICEKHGVARLEGPHCFSFYIGNHEFAAREDTHMRDFFMTDFLARHFKTFLLEPLGLDQHPELIGTYFEHYSRLIYLAQTLNPVLENNARKAAELLGLEYAYEYTGYGDLEGALQELRFGK